MPTAFFETYSNNTPRELLKSCEAHRKACRRAEQVTEARGTDSIHPPPPPPLGWKLELAEKGILGLFVMDEAKDFVPSGKKVPGKENVQRLAAQARKYGLGLLFATQEPKSIEHSIVSNCSTLLGGKMSSPAAINALEQLLADKGTSANDVGKLPRGTFYFGTSPEKPRKVATSLCLSYHPSTPPTEAQVLELARKSKPAS